MELLGPEVRAQGVDRVLVVCDTGVVKAGLLVPVEASLRAEGIHFEVFSGIESNPTEANIEAGVAAYRAASATALVAVGGGSPLDSAKLIGVRSRSERPFEELDDAKGGDQYIPRDLPPVFAIPTTAGTGSEVGRSAVVTVASTHKKTVIFAPWMMPKVALLDPRMTLTMPAHITAATGFDALTHCLEALVALGDHPIADGIALRGLELVHESLQRAVTNGADLEARGAMLKAAMMGAAAFQKGLGACHSMAHPLSAEFGLHHGLANAVCLPAVVEMNLRAQTARASYERISRLWGASSATDLVRVLEDYRSKLGLPGRLRDVGVPEQALPRLAALACEDACHGSNPVPCDLELFKGLFQRAY